MDALSREPGAGADGRVGAGLVTGAAHRLPRWQRWWLHASGGALLVSGTLWLGLHYRWGAGAGELPHPLEAWCMRVHGLAAILALFVLGALAAAHVPQGWRLSARRHWQWQRRSGVALCACATLLALSGYLLYYFAPESIRPSLGWAHSVAGLAMLGFLLAHRRGTRRGGSSSGAASA